MIIAALAMALAAATDSVSGAAPDTLAARTAPGATQAAAAPRDTLVGATAGSSRGLAAAGRVILLPEVRVDRERVLSDARRRLPTAFVSDLSIGVSGRALESLSDVLSEAAGVHVDQYGGLGAFSTVSLRGAAAGQVTVYLDGVPLTSAAHGVVNLADLPVTAVERVEVYRGMAPLAMGVATPGGAINLVTEPARSVRELRVAGGSFGTWEARGTAGTRRGALSALVHAGYQQSQGTFRYLDDNGTPLTTSDDRIVERANAQFDAATAIATVAWEPRGGPRLVASEDLFRKQQGVPGIGSITTRETSLGLVRSLSHLDMTWSGAGWRPTLSARAAYDDERTRNKDPLGELGSGRHDQDDRLASGEGTVGLAWETRGAALALETAAMARAERADLHDALDGQPDPPESRRLTRGLMAGARLRPLPRLTLHAAERWDRIEDHLAASGLAGLSHTDVTRELETPQLGATLAGPAGLEARANWTRTARAPTFEELFGRAGSIIGSPTLRPERAENWDAGLAWSRVLARGARAGAEWAHFESRAQDLVLYERVFQFVRPRNVARALITGEELNLTLAAGAVAAAGSFTWQSPVDESPIPFWNGRPLALRPARQAFGRLAWRGRVVQLAGTVQYIGDNYLAPGGRGLVPSRTITGASFAVTPFGPDFAITVEGKNLGDNHIEDVGGYPLPGRSVFVSCGIRSSHADDAQP